jgi:hypothetical protein
MVEGCDLLDSNLAARWSMDSRADDTVCTLADDVKNLVLCSYRWEFSDGGIDDSGAISRTDIEPNFSGCGGGGGGGMGVLGTLLGVVGHGGRECGGNGDCDEGDESCGGRVVGRRGVGGTIGRTKRARRQTGYLLLLSAFAVKPTGKVQLPNLDAAQRDCLLLSILHGDKLRWVLLPLSTHQAYRSSGSAHTAFSLPPQATHALRELSHS